GKRWRVWCILPESIHPITRVEDYLADCYQLGWLVFETTSGDEKRRLCPFPHDWERLDELTLRTLLAQSEAARQGRFSGEVVKDRDVLQVSAPVVEANDDVTAKTDLTDLYIVRSFRYPGGRLWSAAVAPHSAAANGPVLRFTAGARTFDLE